MLSNIHKEMISSIESNHIHSHNQINSWCHA